MNYTRDLIMVWVYCCHVEWVSVRGLDLCYIFNYPLNSLSLRDDTNCSVKKTKSQKRMTLDHHV